MRRSPIVLTTTAAGLAAVLSFDAHEPSLPTASASATSTPEAADPTASSSGGATRTATGDPIDTRYGAAQVKVTITDGKITDVQALQLQGNDPKSVAISGYAEPLLQQSALAKQSADVDAVSGATFTSASYEQSLQSALDQLGTSSSSSSSASNVSGTAS